jgi:hypothetical protein
MRLLEQKDSGEFSLTKDLTKDIPPYAKVPDTGAKVIHLELCV